MAHGEFINLTKPNLGHGRQYRCTHGVQSKHENDNTSLPQRCTTLPVILPDAIGAAQVIWSGHYIRLVPCLNTGYVQTLCVCVQVCKKIPKQTSNKYNVINYTYILCT